MSTGGAEHRNHQHEHDGRGWLISLAFWLTLLAATLLYAAVALAPKLLMWVRLDREHYRNQVRLVALERRVKHLEKVRRALEEDPSYAEELARLDFPALRRGEERIPVEGPLSLDIREDQPETRPPAPENPSYAGALEVLATRRSIRLTLLAAAALIAVLAFTFLQESPGSARATLRRLGARFAARYRTETDEDRR